MKSLLLVILATLVVAGNKCVSVAYPQEERALANRFAEPNAFDVRNAFYNSLGRIKTGIKKVDAQAILGTPDKAITEGARETWEYGVSPAGSVTIGKIVFNSDAVVEKPSLDIPPDPKLRHLKETELRRLLDCIFQCPSACGKEFNPFDLLKASNQLIVAGKKKTFLAFGEYARINIDSKQVDREKLLLLSRMFNDDKTVPFGQLPTISAGEPFQFSSMKMESITKACPAFPISFIGEVPVLHTIDGYSPVGGARRPLISIVRLLESKIAFRTQKYGLGADSKQQFELHLTRFRDSTRCYFRTQTWLLGQRNEKDMLDSFRSQFERYLESREKEPGPEE